MAEISMRVIDRSLKASENYIQFIYEVNNILNREDSKIEFLQKRLGYDHCGHATTPKRVVLASLECALLSKETKIRREIEREKG